MALVTINVDVGQELSGSGRYRTTFKGSDVPGPKMGDLNAAIAAAEAAEGSVSQTEITAIVSVIIVDSSLVAMLDFVNAVLAAVAADTEVSQTEVADIVSTRDALAVLSVPLANVRVTYDTSVITGYNQFKAAIDAAVFAFGQRA